MQNRKLGAVAVPPIGFGCMNLSHAYGEPPPVSVGQAVLRTALDLGITHFDCAALYGFGRNEELVGPYLQPHRDRIVLVSKCGLRGENGKRTLDGSPAALERDLEASLKRLQTDRIDLYYLHRWDRKVPIEDSIGALSRFVSQGKVRDLGLSEVSAATLRKANAVHPIAAVQSEFSLWSRNAEIGILDACAELGVAFVAFSPLGRGFLTSVDLQPDQFAEKDLRRVMPRFQEPNFARNRALLIGFRQLAAEAGCTPAQLALAWLLHRAPNIHVIPGTTSIAHLHENAGASKVTLSADIKTKLEELINVRTVSGPRYAAATQAEIDTEEFG